MGNVATKLATLVKELKKEQTRFKRFLLEREYRKTIAYVHKHM